MMVEYGFSTLPPPAGTHDTSHSYITVWEDGYMLPSHAGLVFGNGVYSKQVTFDHRRMEMTVTTSGPRSWETTVVRGISRAIRSAPLRTAPPLRLYVRAPSVQLSVGRSVSFFVLNNARAAGKPAAFDLTLQGRWNNPRVLWPYEGQACGGDIIPSLSQQSPARWNINFGDCREVEIVVTPTRPGPHGMTMRTYRLAVDHDGTPIRGRRSLLPNGGFVWSGRAA
jgi:hypothetical protein